MKELKRRALKTKEAPTANLAVVAGLAEDEISLRYVCSTNINFMFHLSNNGMLNFELFIKSYCRTYLMCLLLTLSSSDKSQGF